ncbi:MAG: DUF6033 family protein [Blautia sp.]|nr:DUF6033 family protein [Lachnoclostridium sp.]MCM1210970.1 DUF6033 family protein [Blautia sp.]
MSKIEGYSVYQNNYASTAVKSRNAKDAKKTDETKKNEKKENPVQLSQKAKKLLEKLQKTYGNMDFIVADYASDEEASAYLARGTKEYSVLIDPETLEEMASDDTVREKQIGVLEDAVGQLKDMKEQLGDKKEEVTHLGVSIDKDGSVSYFADLEKAGEKQKEWIEKTLENKKEERSEREKKAQEELTAHERTQKTSVRADSVEELLEKIRTLDWEQVKSEEKQETGGRFDFSI